MKIIESVIIVVLLTICVSLDAQKFYAKSDVKKVLQGSYVKVEFVLENAEGNSFSPPKFDPFRRISGPAVSTSMSYTNGRGSSTQSYTYTLLAEKVGNYTIGSASMIVDGKKVTSSPIVIQVVKGNPNKKQETQEQYFVKIVASDSTAYVGQQIVLNYMLYTKLDVRQYNVLNESEYDGFFKQDLNVPRQYERDIINGVEYYVKPLKRVALFPQRVGTYQIPDVNVTLGISTGQRRGFFQTLDNRTVRAEGMTITVADMLPDQPESFSGAVGNYSIQAVSNTRSLTTDDAIAISMKVNGDGDPKYVNPPEFDLPEGLELYDPNVVRDESNQVGDRLRHTKEFEYLIVAQKSGRYFITPELTYLDPDSNKYITLKARRLNFNVRQGTGVANKPIEVEEKIELSPLATKTRLRESKPMFFGSSLYFLLLGLIAAIIPGLFFYRQKLVKSGAFDLDFQRKKKARLQVLNQLDAELKALPPGENKLRIEVMSTKLNAYITQKFDNKERQFTEQEILTLLTENTIDNGTIEKVESFQNKAQMSIYAGMSDENSQKMYDLIVDIITTIDQQVIDQSAMGSKK